MLKLSDRRLWGFDDAERKVLLGATTGFPELAEVVARAKGMLATSPLARALAVPGLIRKLVRRTG